MYPYPGDYKAAKLIYDKFGQEYIYSIYLGYAPFLNQKYKSPFRDDGSYPSFNVYEDENKILRWNDHGNLEDKLPIKYRDCIGVYQQLSGKSRMECCTEIWNNAPPPLLLKKTESKAKTDPFLEVRTYYTETEWDWWNFIDRSLLKTQLVFPTLKYEHGSIIIESTDNSPSFTYIYGKGSFKVYTPNASKTKKWKSKDIKDVLDGYDQLPETGDTLAIISSKKDGLVVQTYCGIPFVAPPSENSLVQILKKSRELSCRFRNVVVSLDGDNAGHTNTEILCKARGTGFKPIYFPTEYDGIKDQTELVKKGGILKLKSLYL